MSINISVIIINWNQPLLTCDCIQRVTRAISFAKNDMTSKIIVVDNGSTDESVRILRGIPSITLISLPTNRGFAVGCNAALNICHSDDLCLFLNNDAFLEEGALDQLVELILSGETDILSPLIYTTHQNQTWSTGSHTGTYTLRHSNLNVKRAIPNGGMHAPKKTGLIACDAVTFCIVLIPYTTFQKVGDLDENYFMYYEDWDFCLRAKRNGLRIHVCSGVKGYHAVATSSGGRWSVNERFLTGTSLTRFYRKNISTASPILAWLYFFIYIVVYSIRMLSHGRSEATFAYWRGICHGFKSDSGYL
jgi:GT2 family glycosyltransferase